MLLTTLAISVSLTAETASTPVDTGLVAHWSFDKIVSNGFVDEHSTELSALIVRSTEWKKWNIPPKPQLEAGIRGKAFRCGGGGRQHGYFVTVPNPPTLNGPFTIALWTRPDFGGGWGMRIVYYKEMWLGPEGIDLQTSSDRVSLVSGISGGKKKDLRFLTSNIPFQMEFWAYLTITWDGQAWKFYYNGRMVAGDDGGRFPYVQPEGAVPLQLGGHTIHTNSVFQGLLDEVRIWDRALTEQEIVQSMLRDIPQTAVSNRELPPRSDQ